MAFDPDKFLAEPEVVTAPVPVPAKVAFDPDAFLKEEEEKENTNFLSATPGASALSTAGGALIGNRIGAAMDQSKINKVNMPIPPVPQLGPAPLRPTAIPKPLIPVAPVKPVLQQVGTSTPGVAPGQAWKAGTGYGAGSGHTVQEVVAEQAKQNAPIGGGQLTKNIKGPLNLAGITDQLNLQSQEQANAEAVRQRQAQYRAEIQAKNDALLNSYLKEKALHDAEAARIRQKHAEAVRIQNQAHAEAVKEHRENQLKRTEDVNTRNQQVQTQAVEAQKLKNQPIYKKNSGRLGLLGGALGLATSPLAERGYNYLFGNDEEKNVLEGHAAGGAIQGYSKGKQVQQAAHQLGGAPGRITDWLQHHIDKFIVPTQADRMGGVGGPSFSANSLILPQYKGLPWGSGNEGTTTAITNLAKDQRFGGPENQIFMPLLGSQNQHQSNQIVFDRLKDEFYKNSHKLTPEAIAKINAYMQLGGGINPKTGKPNFDPFSQFDIRDKALVDLLGQSFENRGLIAKHGFGGENTGKTKSQVIPYQNILDSMADPLVSGAPTFALGPRAFTLTGGVHPVPRPDLNRAFPYLLEGQDVGHTFNPVANKLIMPDFQNQWRADKGKTELLKSGELPQPGYYENTLGYKLNKNDTERIYPRQKVTEQLLDSLYKTGNKEGGSIQHFDGGGSAKQKVVSSGLQALMDMIKGEGRTPIVPVPNRWFANPEKFPNVQGLVNKTLESSQLPREAFHSGAFIDPRTGKVLDRNIYDDVGVMIDPRTGRPMMSAGQHSSIDVLDPKTGSYTKSNLVRNSLFKPTGGDPMLNDIPFIATIEKANMGHKYGLGTEYATPTELFNTMTGANPTLRPRSRGDVFGMGDVVGQVQVGGRGIPHDVYEKLFVAPKGSDVPGVKLNKAEGGEVQHLKGGGLTLVERLANKAKAFANRHPDVPDVMYHGTSADINQFVPKQAGATFLSPNAKFANDFTDQSENFLAKNLLKKLNTEDQDKFAALKKSAISIANKNGTHWGDELETLARNQLPTRANILPVHVNATNPFDYENQKHLDALRINLAKNADVRDAYKQVNNLMGGNWSEIESPAVQQAIKGMGHDSFWVREGGQKNLGIYDPNQIKSSIGNRGTYDFTNPDITKAEGGLMHLAGGGEAWQRSEGKNPEGGLNAKGRASYNKAHGAHLKAPQPEGGSRKDSFCARMSGMKKKLTSSETANDPDSRINKSLRKWKC